MIIPSRGHPRWGARGCGGTRGGAGLREAADVVRALGAVCGVALALRSYLIVEYLLRAAEESVKLAMGSRREERQARLRVIGLGLRGALGL